MPESEKQSQGAVVDKDPAKEQEAEKNSEEGQSNPAEKLTPEHPRFQEVYGKWKATERTTEQLKKSLEEKELDIQLIRQHNQRLEEKFNAVSEKVHAKTEEPAPNPIEDPEGYQKWLDARFDEKQNKLSQQAYQQRVSEQIEDQRDLHDDYETVVKPVMQEMERDPELKKKIWNSVNPAREAYRYGKKKMTTQGKEKEATGKETEEERKRAIDQGSVEAGSPPPLKQAKVKLTEEQARVARGLGVSEEKYLKQIEMMEKRR